MQEISTPPNRIRELRKAHGDQLRVIATVIDRGEPMVSRYERGEAEPPLEIVRILAERWGVTVEYLMGWDRQQPSEAAA